MAGGGLKVGDVYVVVTAAVGEFTRSMRKIVADVASTAGKVEQLGNKIGEIGAIVSAGLYGALAAAAAFDSSITERMERIGLVFQTVGAEIGDAVLPHLERLSSALEQALGWFQRLDPVAKSAMGSFLFLATGAGLAGGAVGKVAGVVKQLAESTLAFVVPALDGAGKSVVRFSEFLRAETPVVEGNMKKVAKGAEQVDASFARAFRNAAARVLLVGAPLAAVALAVTGVVMLAGTLYRAWHDSSTGMRDAFVSVGQAVADVASRIGKFFQQLFAGLADLVGKWARGQLDMFATVVRGLARLAAPLARALNLDGIANTLDGLRDLTGDAVLGGLKGLVDGTVSTLRNGLASVWEGVTYGASYAFDGVKLMGSDAAAFLREKFGGVFDDLRGPKGKLREKAGEPEIEVGKAPLQEFDAKAFLARVGNAAAILHQVAQRKAKELADALARAADEAKRALTSRFSQAFGRIYELVDRFQQGMSAGGVWGGLIAVVAELLSQSTTFGTLLQMVTNFIQYVADVLGRVLAPVLPLLASVFNMVTPILDALVPVLEMFARPVQAITPIFELLGTLFEGLAPVITVFGQILVALMQPLTVLSGPIMKGLFAVVRVVAMGILYVVKGIGTVWNAIIGFIAGVFKTLSKIPLVGGAFKKMAQGLDSMKVPMDAVDSALETLKDTSYDTAAANAAAGVAAWENAAATNRATEALLNVPTGFKVALARFNAMEPIPGSSSSPLGSSPLTPSPAVPVSGGNVSVGQIIVQGVDDPEETARNVYLEIKREAHRRRGNGEWLPPRY
ncbi:phage tail protein [Myxococcus landrumensis]|uniref:Phage tail protein n=1 Tax=Myxococcus landrumensis TaxID=2813577 RepID=A0ABX7MWE2_9BACT|nr:phage tail protein [Myxococcus landrumus]QSQ10755.1 phage tail protein [Myxococcus landrumus]